MHRKRVSTFLCHSSGDKEAVRDLHRRLLTDGFAPWLDEEDLLPGQNWSLAIEQAVRDCDVVIACLSKASISKTGFVNKEIGYALDRAEEKPEGLIYLIPARLEECEVPQRLSRWHRVDLFKSDGYEKLLRSLSSAKTGVQPKPGDAQVLAAIQAGKYVSVPLRNFVRLVVLSGQVSSDEMRSFVDSALGAVSGDIDWFVDGEQDGITVRGGKLFIWRSGTRDVFEAAKTGVGTVLRAAKASLDGTEAPEDASHVSILIRGLERFFDVQEVIGVRPRTWIGFDLR